jgi:hypothetical protein
VLHTLHLLLHTLHLLLQVLHQCQLWVLLLLLLLLIAPLHHGYGLLPQVQQRLLLLLLLLLLCGGSSSRWPQVPLHGPVVAQRHRRCHPIAIKHILLLLLLVGHSQPLPAPQGRARWAQTIQWPTGAVTLWHLEQVVNQIW